MQIGAEGGNDPFETVPDLTVCVTGDEREADDDVEGERVDGFPGSFVVRDGAARDDRDAVVSASQAQGRVEVGRLVRPCTEMLQLLGPDYECSRPHRIYRGHLAGLRLGA